MVGTQQHWRVEVLLYTNPLDDTAFHIFDAPLPHDSFFNLIQDAAWVATRRLRHMYDAQLNGTGFHYYPFYYRTNLCGTFCSTKNEDFPSLTHQVDLTVEMDHSYHAILNELRIAHLRL